MKYVYIKSISKMLSNICKILNYVVTKNVLLISFMNLDCINF